MVCLLDLSYIWHHGFDILQILFIHGLFLYMGVHVHAMISIKQ